MKYTKTFHEVGLSDVHKVGGKNASLSIYVNEYPKKMLREFYDYWTEHGVKDKKMRFEKEKTFGIEQRLRTWYNRNPKQYDQDNDPNPPEYYIAKAQGLC